MNEPTRSGGIVPSGFFALRTPLLPFDDLLDWSADLEAPVASHDPKRLEEALAADRVRLRNRLRDVVARPEVREALFVASPDLEDRLQVWLRNPDSDAGQKMERALVRYFARMAGRATPFGLFAGCSVGMLGPTTRLTLVERGRYRRHTRLDMDYVVALTEALVREPGLRASLAFQPNTSLYCANGRVRYAEVRRNGKGWTHHRVALESSDYLDATLKRACQGARPEVLAATLVETDPEASREEAAEYVGELIDNQVLVSELAPSVTGPEPIHGLVARLRERTPDWGQCLGQTRAALEALDDAGVGVAPECYRDIAQQLTGLARQRSGPRGDPEAARRGQQPPHGEQGHEATDQQGVGPRIEAAIQPHDASEFLRVGGAVSHIQHGTKRGGTQDARAQQEEGCAAPQVRPQHAVEAARPQQIKLLFQGERPSVAQRGQSGLMKCRPVRHVAGGHHHFPAEDGLVLGPEKHGGEVAPEQHGEKRRHEPQGAS